ncbi:hypothetical protein PG990_013754 [Apiospora arundinis]
MPPSAGTKPEINGGACGPSESGLPSIVVTDPVPPPPLPLSPTTDAGDVIAVPVDGELSAKTPAEAVPLPLPPAVIAVATLPWQASPPTLRPPPILTYPLLPTIFRTKLLPWMYCPKFVARPESSTASGPENSAHL